MRMSVAELASSLAHLVWESFTDFLERSPISVPEQDEAGGTAVMAVPAVDPVEALIFFMWLHTRACQQAFPSSPEQTRQVLDAMHRALYEDLEARAIPRVQLPLFEQRVSARYLEYYEAATNLTEQKVVEVAARHIRPESPGEDTAGHRVVLGLAESATATSGPLLDYLKDIQLTDD